MKFISNNRTNYQHMVASIKQMYLVEFFDIIELIVVETIET